VIELHCLHCRGGGPLADAAKRQGDMTFEALLRRLRCSCQAANPAPVYLVAGHHRTACGGPDLDWAIFKEFVGSKLIIW
jgi:hypothetical protein